MIPLEHRNSYESSPTKKMLFVIALHNDERRTKTLADIKHKTTLKNDSRQRRAEQRARARAQHPPHATRASFVCAGERTAEIESGLSA